MGSYGIVKDSIVSMPGILWDCMGFYRFLWDSMGFYGISMPGILWDLMGCYGFLSMGFYGFLWVYWRGLI